MIFLRVFNFVIFFSSLRFSVLGEHGFDDCNRLCETDGSNAYFDWDTTTDESFVIVKTNQCAQHEIENGVGENPNRACSAFPSIDFYIPKVPVYRDNSSGINDNILYNEGSSLISISGGIMYGPAIGPNGGDAGTHEIDTFDYCGSHADPDGILHYHVEPYCITLAANETEVGTVLNPTHKHSILFGWSPDGFPVYGPLGDDGEEPDDLDECQGHASDSGAGGGYHYHYTGPLGPFPQDSNDVGGYPYYMACFKGCIPDETVNADDLQAETYAECLSSSFDAPSGSYSAEFFDSFSGLDFSNIKFVLSDATDSPTTSPTISPTDLPSVSPTGSASTGVLGNDFSNGCTSDDDCNSSQSCICKERRLRSKKSKKISEKTVGDRSLLFGKYDDCFCA